MNGGTRTGVRVEFVYWGTWVLRVGRPWKRASFSIWTSLGTMKRKRLREKDETLLNQENLSIGESERYVKEGSGNGPLSL
jgi:hypothetical protein